MAFLFNKTTIALFVEAILVTIFYYHSSEAKIYVNNVGDYFYKIFNRYIEVQKPSFALSVLFLVLAALPLALILTFIIDAYANVKHKKILRILYDRCDYEEFQKMYQPILKKEKRIVVLTNPFVVAVRLHYARALFLSGDTQAAIQVLEEILGKRRMKRRRWQALKTAALCSLTLFYYFEENTEKALLYYEKSNAKFSEYSKFKLLMAKQNFYISVTTNTALGLIMNGEYEKAEEAITAGLKKKMLALDRLYLNCLLSRVYLKTGNIDKAMESFNIAEEMALESYPVLKIGRKMRTMP